MRAYDGSTSAFLTSQTGMVARALVWVSARNRSTGATETMGLWTGDDHQDFTIGGVVRSYFGAGSVLALEPITMATGLDVRMQRLTLAPVAPEVETLIRGYDVRLAPVEIHRALFDPVTQALIAEPLRTFLGWIDSVSIPTPVVGGQASIEVTLASLGRSLTRSLALKQSDGTLRLRAPDDGFRKYAALSGTVDTVWGENRARAPGTTTPAPATGAAREHGGGPGDRT